MSVLVISEQCLEYNKVPVIVNQTVWKRLTSHANRLIRSRLNQINRMSGRLWSSQSYQIRGCLNHIRDRFNKDRSLNHIRDNLHHSNHCYDWWINGCQNNIRDHTKSRFPITIEVRKHVNDRLNQARVHHLFVSLSGLFGSSWLLSNLRL